MVSYYTIIIIAHVNISTLYMIYIHACTSVNKYIYWIDAKSIVRDKSEHALNMAHFCKELHYKLNLIRIVASYMSTSRHPFFRLV